MLSKTLFELLYLQNKEDKRVKIIVGQSQ
jgi:hypothetical protein